MYDYTHTVSPRYVDAYNKVLKVIESCVNHTQVLTTEIWIDKIKNTFSEPDYRIFLDRIYIKHHKLLRNSNG